MRIRGNPGITGSRDAAREAFQTGLIEDGEGWMEMIRSRNQTSHTYQQKVADAIGRLIVERYFPLFRDFQQRMSSLKTAS